MCVILAKEKKKKLRERKYNEWNGNVHADRIEKEKKKGTVV